MFNKLEKYSVQLVYNNKNCVITESYTVNVMTERVKDIDKTAGEVPRIVTNKIEKPAWAVV